MGGEPKGALALNTRWVILPDNVVAALVITVLAREQSVALKAAQKLRPELVQIPID